MNNVAYNVINMHYYYAVYVSKIKLIKNILIVCF